MYAHVNGTLTKNAIDAFWGLFIYLCFKEGIDACWVGL